MPHDAFSRDTLDELHNILQWWMSHMTDLPNGGFFGRMDGLGTLHAEADKGVILNTRILWTFSAAARQTGRADYGQMANRAYNYLITHFIDPEFGGVFWAVDFKGQPLHTKKQVYAQAFAVYALSEYFQLTSEPQGLHLAFQIFNLLEEKAFDNQQNGYFEAYSRDWQLLADLRLSDKDANEAKTQNTHLHLLEAYANLLRASKMYEYALPAAPPEQYSSVRVTAALQNLVHLFLEKFIDPETAHIHLFFDENWQLKSDIISFGHDIEASWLIWDAVQTIENQQLIDKTKPVCLKIADVTLQEAVEPDGSVINERKNNQLDTDRIWWVQAEAIVGFWNAYLMSGDPRFQQAAFHCWQFTQDKMRDPVGGEWFWRVAPSGAYYPEEDKAGFWKCPYHNGRAMMWIGNADARF